ncbi:hypothetical protein WH240_12605 [Gluconobacter wancherniae]
MTGFKGRMALVSSVALFPLCSAAFAEATTPHKTSSSLPVAHAHKPVASARAHKTVPAAHEASRAAA